MNNKLSEITVNENGITHIYWCEGCEHCHGVRVGASDKPSWTLTGTLDNPTLSPSILTVYEPLKGQDRIRCKKNKFLNGGRCHHFVRGGMIFYLGDCTHELKGQTIEMDKIFFN